MLLFIGLLSSVSYYHLAGVAFLFNAPVTYCSFPLNSFLQILLLILELLANDVLLLLSALLTVLHKFLGHELGLGVDLLKLLLVFLFFYQHGAGLSPQDFRYGRLWQELLHFLLVEQILVGTPFLIKLDSFLSNNKITLY